MDKDFLQYCLKVGAFTEEAFRRVTASVAGDASLYATIVKAKVISENSLAVTAGEFYRAPVVDLTRIVPDPRATVYGSLEDCRKLDFLPFTLDPVVGLLVAVVDYAKIHAVKAFLQTMHVTAMKFYIAPVETLRKSVELVYEAKSESSLSSRMNRKASILKTQSSVLPKDALKRHAKKNNVALGVDVQRLQAMSVELSDCQEEVATLRQRVEQLNATVSLESRMIRELAKILRDSGILDARGFEQWLLTQR